MGVKKDYARREDSKRLTGGFPPFILRTSDGRECDVPHPEFIAVGKYDVAVVDPEGDIDILDSIHIVSLKLRSPKNGPARQR